MGICVCVRPHLASRTVSLLFRHSQWLYLSATVASSLYAFHWTWLLIPISFSGLVVELTTKPLQLISTGHTLAFQSLSSASNVKLLYRSLFDGTLPTDSQLYTEDTPSEVRPKGKI